MNGGGPNVIKNGWVNISAKSIPAKRRFVQGTETLPSKTSAKCVSARNEVMNIVNKLLFHREKLSIVVRKG